MKPLSMMKRGRIQDLDRSFDIQFWQQQEPKVRFNAAWELIVHAGRVKGYSELLKTFNDNNVQYLVIGGYALIQYAEPRYTKDLDLWISTTPENATAVFNSLKQFGAPLDDLTSKDFAEDGFFYQMGIITRMRLSLFASVRDRRPDADRSGRE